MTIIDSNINYLYPSLQRNSNIVIECNEDAKTLDGAGILLNELKNRNANIKTKLLV